MSFVSRAYSTDPLERINSIGGTNADRTRWEMAQSAAIVVIEDGTQEFFAQIDGVLVKFAVHTHQGQKYLRSEREAAHPGELLTLLPR